MAQIESVSHTHDQVMNWLVLNPEKYLRECADHFGYTQSWLSTLIHSDVFQAKLKERQDSVFTHVMQDIPEKLRGLADIAIDQLGTQLESNTDKNYSLDAFEKILKTAGYGVAKSSAPIQNNNVFMVSREALSSARDSMRPFALPVSNTEVEVTTVEGSFESP